jgi:isopropylmalate/homocitrate/citramalate synthase
VGAPRNSLVLGKHSGRNALRVRYEKLGFTFERAQLDDVYRRFVALADKIKTIEDGHLLELVRDVPSRTTTLPDSAGKTASTWMAAVSKEDVQPAHPDPVSAKEKAHAAHAAHESEQEDYLWGV